MNKYVKTQITIEDLQIGMRVVELDRPWLETSFLLQGFVIQSQEDIEELQQQCEFVYIEGTLETNNKEEKRKEKRGLFARTSDLLSKKPSLPKPKTQPREQGPPLPENKVVYINKISVEKEIDNAKVCYSAAKNIVKNIMEGIRLGRMLDMNQARKTVDEVVDSILSNSDALAWLTKIKNKDDYTAEHSLNVCVLSATFARHLGHDEREIRQVALGGLLHDVGKAKIPLEILNKPGRFTNEEFDIMKQHPTFGRSMLMSLPQSDLSAVDIAFCHHERMDEQGYPRGLKAHQIPYFAKLVSLTDAYDAITSSRCYDQGRASMDALDIIYQHKGKQFDEELAVEFIKCVGVYPAGSIVEMTNKEVGIVIAANEKKKLKPRIILVMDTEQNWIKQSIIDLYSEPRDADGNIYNIARELANGTHGIDIRDFVEKGLVLHR